MRKVGWQVGCLLMSALACGGLARNETAGKASTENAAGHEDEGGAGSALVGGAGGAGAGGSAGRGYDCNAPKDLAEYCSKRVCPQTPDDVDLGYCDVGTDEYPRVTRGASSCGGVSVSRNSIYGGASYHFDADDRLIGVSWWSDSIDDCPHGVGRECTLQGLETTLCGDLERCGAVDLKYFCDAPDACPPFDSPEGILQQFCGGDDVLERFASSCNGSVFRHHSGAMVSEWSFDATGELAGVTVASDSAVRCLDGGYSKVAVFGHPCEAMGEGDDECGAGGQGGAGGSAGGRW